jgi:iron complex transport system substrate-binding protein
MKKNISVFSIVLLFLISCNNEQQKKEATVSLTHIKQNNYATYFKIYKEADFAALVTYVNKDKTDSLVYVLYSNEKPKLNSNAYYIKTPLKSAAVLDAFFIGALNNLNCLNYITAIDNSDYVYNPIIKKKCAENKVQQLSKSGVLNIEQTLVCKPEALFINPSGDTKKDFDPRLLKATITPVVCADYYENNPLGRVEWVKALALFFNVEQRADSLFSSIEKKYVQLQSITDTCTNKPTVFTELKTGDVWFVPGGKSTTAQLLKNAGADFIFKDNDKTASVSLNMEQVISKATNADYWINLHYCNIKTDIIKQDKRYAVFNAYKKGNLYNNNALIDETGGNAYWESGLNHPDELLADLIKIFHPALLSQHTLKYYKQLK